MGDHLPSKLRGIFREKQVVSLVVNSKHRTDEDVIKDGHDNIERIVMEMANKGVSKDSVDSICF